MRALLVTLFLIAPAAAQQQPPPALDPAVLGRAITALQQQRNQAMDAAANIEVQRAALAEQVDKLKAELEELKKRAAVEQPPRKK